MAKKIKKSEKLDFSTKGSILAISNSTILDRIRLKSTNEYQQRIPESTKSGIEAIKNTLFDPANETLYNEFVHGFVNRLGVTMYNSPVFTNPFDKLKKVGNDGGKTIEEAGFELHKGHDYDPDDRNYLTKEAPKIKTAFHVENRETYYQLTIKEYDLLKAFDSPNGLSEFMYKAIQNIYNSMAHDEYTIIKNMFEYFDNNIGEGIYNVQVPNLNTLSATKEDSTYVSKAIRATSGDMSVELSTDYNPYGIPTLVNKDQLLLVTTPTVEANLDVEVLADAFNIDRADVKTKTILIKDQPINNGVAYLLDEEAIIYRDNMPLKVTKDYNKIGLDWTFFFHVKQTISMSPMRNIVKFTTDANSTLPLATFTPNTTADVWIEEIDKRTGEYLSGSKGNLIDLVNLKDSDYKFIISLGGAFDGHDKNLFAEHRGGSFQILTAKTADDTATPIRLTPKTNITKDGYIMLQDDIINAEGVNLEIAWQSDYDNEGYNGTINVLIGVDSSTPVYTEELNNITVNDIENDDVENLDVENENVENEDVENGDVENELY